MRLVQECGNSSAEALELPQSSAKPSWYNHVVTLGYTSWFFSIIEIWQAAQLTSILPKFKAIWK